MPAVAVLFLVLALVSSEISPALASELSIEQHLENGNKLFAEGKFDAAVEQYQHAKEQGLDSAGLHYNLGNSYYRLAKYGKAIASFRRALLRQASDPDTLFNLELARNESTDKLQEVQASQTNVSDFSKAILNAFTREQLKITFLVVYLFFWALLPLTLLYPNTVLLRLRFPVALLCLLLFVPAFCSRNNRLGNFEFAFSSELRNRENAVVTAEELKLFSGNSEKYQIVFILHEGAEIEIAEQRGDWVEVLLPNARKGWATRENFEFIS